MSEYIIAVFLPFVAAFINKKWIIGIFLTMAFVVELFIFWWQIHLACAAIALLIVYNARKSYKKWEKFKADLNVDDQKRMVDRAHG